MDQTSLMGYTGFDILRSAFAAVVAILFLQSSLDKLFNWKSEKEFLTGHFAKSILRNSVPIMLPLITMVELLAGLCCASGFVQVLVLKGQLLGLVGMCLGSAAVVMLFFGQRVAKDYAGAAALIPYFLLTTAGLYLFAL